MQVLANSNRSAAQAMIETSWISPASLAEATAKSAGKNRTYLRNQGSKTTRSRTLRIETAKAAARRRIEGSVRMVKKTAIRPTPKAAGPQQEMKGSSGS